MVCPCGTIRKASKPEGGEEAMKKAALTILGLAISALVYTKVGLMIMVGLLAVLFVAIALNRPKEDKPRGL